MHILPFAAVMNAAKTKNQCQRSGPKKTEKGNALHPDFVRNILIFQF